METVATWPGVLDEAVLNPDHVTAVDRLADAAKAGRWPVVVDLLDTDPLLSVNQWRIGGRSQFTPLHQVAWLGAPVEVAEDLLRRGAWRSLRTAAGDRAVDIARARGHDHLLTALDVPEPDAAAQRRFTAWDRLLTELITERTARLDPVSWRPIPTEIIAVDGLAELWFAYPGMYGGFTVSIHRNRLFVENWSRVVGGSGQAHVITERGRVLVDRGFV